MAIQTFTLTDADIGRSLDPGDGYLVSLSMTAAPTGYEVAGWDEGRGCWATGRLVLRGSHAFRDSVCVDPYHDGGWGSSGTGLVLTNASIAFSGDLQVIWTPMRSQGLSQTEKAAITAACQRLIDEVLKPRFLPVIRPTEFNYPVDICGKWHGTRYRFIQRYRSGFPENLGEEFDAPFTRLDWISPGDSTFNGIGIPANGPPPSRPVPDRSTEYNHR